MEHGQKIGQGHASAMARLGAKELAQVLPAFPAGSVQPIEEPGLVGNLTPQEVVRGKGIHDNYESRLQQYAAQQGPPDPQRAMER